MPAPNVPFNDRTTSLLAQLKVPWVRHALAFTLAVVVPVLLRALTRSPSPSTSFLGFLLLALGLALVLVGIGLYAWWLHTLLMNRKVDAMNEHWRLGHGPTRYTRHPAWLAVMALVLGQAMFTTTLWMVGWAAFVIVGLTVLVIRHDEPELARIHGAVYDDYREHVSRWLPWRFVLQMLREIGQMLRNSVR